MYVSAHKSTQEKSEGMKFGDCVFVSDPVHILAFFFFILFIDVLVRLPLGLSVCVCLCEFFHLIYVCLVEFFFFCARKLLLAAALSVVTPAVWSVHEQASCVLLLRWPLGLVT